MSSRSKTQEYSSLNGEVDYRVPLKVLIRQALKEYGAARVAVAALEAFALECGKDHLVVHGTLGLVVHGTLRSRWLWRGRASWNARGMADAVQLLDKALEEVEEKAT